MFDRSRPHRTWAVWPLALAVVLLCILAASSRTSAQGIPDPIDPDSGEANLLDLINGLPINDIETALNNFPVPYVAVASAGGADPVIINKKAGSPTRIDADRSKTTGQGGGGDDLIVEVNTELFPTPHLVLSIERLGNAPFASDLTVLVAFPFDGFNDEDGSDGGDSPNLFFGFQTTAAFDPGSETYPAGGHAPQRVEFLLTPGILAGTDHIFDLQINTTGADNPVRFLAGHFNGVPGEIPTDAIAMGIHTDPVPAAINLGLDLTASAILTGGATQGSFGLDWDASASSKVTFDYIENETFPFTIPDYGTTVTFDQMPTSEDLTIDVNFPAQTIAIDHMGSAPVGELTVNHRRADGLDVTMVASDVPTVMNVALSFSGGGGSGQVDIDVNANTMDFELTTVQEGGFPGSDGLFGYPLGFLYVAATDVPDTTASYDATAQSFSVSATNPGECATCDHIGSLAFIMDDDATSLLDELGNLNPALELPPDQAALLTGVGVPWEDAGRHVFSIVDDGTHGTAAARIIRVKTATLDLDAADLNNLSETYTLDLAEPAAPLTAYILLDPASNLTDEDIEVTCNIHDFPHGVTTFDLTLPPPDMGFSYTTNPPQTIEEVFCVGHVNTLNFEAIGGDLPPELAFSYDPAGSLSVTAGDGLGGPAKVGALGIRLWDEEDENGLGAGTASLLGAPLRDGRFRADGIPSLLATWSDGPAGTVIDFDTTAATGEFAFLEGLQVAASTIVELGTPFPAADGTQDHFVTLVDEGPDEKKSLAAGVFGINHVNITTTEGGGARSLALLYEANEDHTLNVDIDSTFGGRFFPDYDVDLQMVVDDVPQSWSFSTNFATELDYTASDGIDSITIDGTIDDTDDDTDNPTTVDIDLIGLPSEVHFLLVPELEGSASLMMSNPITEIRAELTSDVGVFGEPYKHVLLSIQDIPANWNAEWGETPDPHASLTADAPLGPVTVILSRDVADNTPMKYEPFEAAGGTVNYSAFTREIDRRYFRQGSGDDATRETVFMSRLDDIYGRTAQLDDSEDHVIYRQNGDGDLDFLSVQGTGFQSVSATLASTITASLAIPVPGDHPFYVGLEDANDKFTVVQIENIPDTTDISIGATHANVDFNSAPGDILVYQGPLPGAGDSDEVLKVIVDDAPSFIHASWNLGFPGHVTIDTSNPVEVKILSQDGSDRTIFDFVVGDLSAEWGYDTGFFEFDVDLDGVGEFFVIAEAFFEFTASPAIDGFIANYQHRSAQALDGGPSPDGNEYVPRVTVLVDDFNGISASAKLRICVAGICAIGIPTVDVDIDLDSSAFNFDFWDYGDDDHSILGDPDYVDNDPWDLWPIFHDQDNHLFPFGP